MDAFILAAGRGERMRPLTDDTPKPLLDVGGRALIEHHVVRLRAAGFSRIVVNVAWLGEKIMQALGDGSRFGVEIVYSVEEPGALETAGGIVNALPLLSSPVFALVSADVWTDFDFSRLEPAPGLDAGLVMVDNPPHHPSGDFLLENGHVAPRNGRRAGLTYSGVGWFSRALFEPLEPGHRKLRPVIEDAMRGRRVAGILHKGRWMDIGSPERLAAADAMARHTTTP